MYESSKGDAMFEKGTDQALALDVLGLQALPSVGEVTQLGRRHRRRGGGGDTTINACLITLSNVLNGLNVLNLFGGGL
jgi:hypothetical protein